MQQQQQQEQEQGYQEALQELDTQANGGDADPWSALQASVTHLGVHLLDRLNGFSLHRA